MSLYSVDLIEWTSVTEDENGVKTEAVAVPIKCQIENVSELIAMSNGQDLMSNALILIDEEYAIKQGDYILLKEKFGVLTGDSRLYTVIKVDIPLNFSFSHMEVWI